MSELAKALLEAQVRHELARFGDGLVEQVSASTEQLFRWFATVRLDDVSNVAQVMGVFDRYVIEMRLSGGITELVGEMSQIVFHSQHSADTRLNEVLDEVHYERFAEKVTALDAVRREVISIVARSEAFEQVSARLFSRAMSDLMADQLPSRRLAARLLPALERKVGSAIAGYLERHRNQARQRAERRLLETLDPECVRSVADEIWASVASLPLTDAFVLISEQDLEDFVVLGYEFWQRYRKTRYFRDISEEVVGHFFDKYGRQSLLALLTDLGVTQQMVTQELTTFLAPLITEALRSGFLEQRIRARLEPFYRSPELAALLPRE